MKKCQFCAEEIQDEAIKCKHCGEWLPQEETPIEELKESEIDRVDKRVSCPDGNCIGTIKNNGLCSICNKREDDIPDEDGQDSIPNEKYIRSERLAKQFSIIFWGIMASWIFFVLSSALPDPYNISGIFLLFPIIFLTLAFYIQVGRIASFLKRSVFNWVAISIIFSYFGAVYSFFKLTNLLREETFK